MDLEYVSFAILYFQVSVFWVHVKQIFKHDGIKDETIKSD